MQNFRVIDLFCGAGGFSLGFSKEFGRRFDHIAANDIDKSCVETYGANFGPVVCYGDIEDELETWRIPQADVVIGGPPCQGFSLLNRNRRSDARKSLWKPFLKVVGASGAKVFVIENVPPILGSDEHHEMVEMAERMGFLTCSGKLNAADYGVPQTRIRAFIIGSRGMHPGLVFPPPRTHADPKDSEPGLHRWLTVRDAIGDLPSVPVIDKTAIRSRPPLNLHFGRNPSSKSLKRYKAIPFQGMNRFDLQRAAPELTPKCWLRKKTGTVDVFGRLWWDRPATTIRTEFFKPEKGRYLHPEHHRVITHREAARLQGFPDDFVFAGSKIQIASQIGNSVPPPLAAAIAGCVEKLLEAN